MYGDLFDVTFMALRSPKRDLRFHLKVDLCSLKIFQFCKNFIVASKACFYYSYRSAKVCCLLCNVYTNIAPLRYFWNTLYTYRKFYLEHEIRCLKGFNLRIPWSWTQDTSSSKIIKRFVPSFARKNCQAQFPTTETNQLGKPQRGNCQKKRSGCPVSERCNAHGNTHVLGTV